MTINNISKINTITKDILYLNNLIQYIDKCPDLRKIIFIFESDQLSLDNFSSSLLKNELTSLFKSHLNQYKDHLQEELKNIVELIEDLETD